MTTMNAPMTEVASFTAALADFASGLTLEAVPTAAIDIARRSMLDTAGVALAGTPEPASRNVAAMVAEQGARPVATVIGAGLGTSAALAALANGTSGHALDFDDVSGPMRGHPSVVCAAASLAATEAAGGSGADALRGYVAGVEVMVCLAYAAGRRHYDRGWHSTSTLGSIAAAAACANVRGLDAERTRVALAIAASMSSGLRRNFGSMTKPLHAGHAARCGVDAAALAAHGFSADPCAIEAPLGFFALFAERADLGAASRLGRDWGVLTPGLNLKRHPCCYAAHHAIDATLALREAHALTGGEIERIDVDVAPRGLTALIHDRPQTGLEAKFSLPYTLAVALVDGEVSLAKFTDACVGRVELQALLRKVHAREAAGDPESVETPRFAEVTLALADGRRLQQRVQYPRGAAANPMTDAEVDRKFLDCAQVRLAPAEAARALELLRGIDRLPRLDALMTVLAGRPD